jgi:curli biogenesis system outer membrane secretion channel CsgG
MRRSLLILAVLLAASWAAPRPTAAQDGRPVVMVVDFAVAVGWSPASEVVTDRVIARLREDGSVRVLSRSETRSALESQRLDARGILDLQEVSRAAARAGADYVIMGEVEQFDQDHRGGCLPIVGCAYTITATVRIRGVVVDSDTGVALARPEGQAQRSQGAASVWVGPWWTHVSVSNFDAQLIGRVTLEAVAQFVSRAKPALRAKPGRPREAQPSPSEPQRPADTAQPAPSGGLQRPQVGFQRGDRIVWNENFSGCALTPAGMQVVEGRVECVQFDGRKWLAGVRSRTWVARDLPDLDFSRDFAVEVTVHLRPDMDFALALGRPDSPYVLRVHARGGGFAPYIRWAGQALPQKGDYVGTQQLAVLFQGGTFHVFLNGERLASAPGDPIVLQRLPRRLFFLLGEGHTDIERQLYTLVTDVVVSQFTGQ